MLSKYSMWDIWPFEMWRCILPEGQHTNRLLNNFCVLLFDMTGFQFLKLKLKLRILVINEKCRLHSTCIKSICSMYVSELMFKSKIHDIYRYNGEMLLLWHFQEVIEAQEKTITNLLKAVREQHDQLDNQKIKIKNLEEKVDNC